MGRGRSGILRRLSVPAAVLLLALVLVLPSSAVAATGTTKESTSGYNQEPNKPSTGTSPSKEAGTPTTTSKAPAPATSGSSPGAAEPKASTLPYTGFDLRWSIGIGLLLIGAGFSIVAVQRRQRRDSGR